MLKWLNIILQIAVQFELKIENVLKFIELFFI